MGRAKSLPTIIRRDIMGAFEERVFRLSRHPTTKEWRDLLASVNDHWCMVNGTLRAPDHLVKSGKTCPFHLQIDSTYEPSLWPIEALALRGQGNAEWLIQGRGQLFEVIQFLNTGRNSIEGIHGVRYAKISILQHIFDGYTGKLVFSLNGERKIGLESGPPDVSCAFSIETAEIKVTIKAECTRNGEPHWRPIEDACKKLHFREVISGAN